MINLRGMVIITTIAIDIYVHDSRRLPKPAEWPGIGVIDNLIVENGAVDNR